MTSAPAKLKPRLKRKAEYLIRQSTMSENAQLEAHFIDEALEFSRVGLIGGAIRDLVYQGCRDFKSDLDFVLEVHDQQGFKHALARWKPKKTNFGGYRMDVGGVQIDFWEANQSWAHREKLVEVNTLSDVLKCTFFNLDAVIYDVAAKQLLVEDEVIAAYESKILGINLRPNPNVDGAAVRALRRLWAFDLSASKELIDFIAERIQSSEWVGLAQLDARAFPQSPILAYLFEGERLSTQEFRDFMDDFEGKLPKPKQQEFEFLDSAA